MIARRNGGQRLQRTEEESGQRTENRGGITDREQRMDRKDKYRGGTEKTEDRWGNKDRKQRDIEERESEKRQIKYRGRTEDRGREQRRTENSEGQRTKERRETEKDYDRNIYIYLKKRLDYLYNVYHSVINSKNWAPFLY